MIDTATNRGLHDFVGEQVLARFVRSGLNAADFGSGPGATTAGLRRMGCDVIAANQSTNEFAPQLPHLKVRRLLSSSVLAFITIPNVDSLPARLKLLVAGKIRTMAEHGEPTYIPLIFFDLLQSQFHPFAGLLIHQHLLFLAHGFQLSRRTVVWSMCLAASVFPRGSVIGDNHILVFEAAA